ncbi:MAG: hypothetical protein HYV47_02270 [Candidatus Nealsonbacteria bacterium]|nr:hypothetical protein [Candidatus Nealsonbacteria bacterium]
MISTCRQKGQIQIVVLVVAVLVIAGIYFGARFFGKSDGEQIGKEKIIENSNDDVPPLRTNLLPSGVLSLNTSKTTLTLVTDEPAYCRYSSEPDQAYINMSKGFGPDKNKTSHSVNASGLENGKVYKYHVRCQDMAGNRNTEDALIEFSVGSAVSRETAVLSAPLPSEAPPTRSNLLPSGTLSSGTTKTTIGLITNESAYCRYASQSQPYINMSKGFSSDKDKLQHTATVSGLADNKIYEYYVRCRDVKGNENDDDAIIRFGIGGASVNQTPLGADATPPNRFSASPSGSLPVSTRQTNIKLQTDEKAICRYSETAGLGYDSMKNFSNTNSTSHLAEILGLDEGGSYKFYVRCADQYGNKNTNDFIISFKVETAEDEIPPILSNPSHNGNILPSGTAQVVISISTNEPSACRYSANAGTVYNSMSGRFSYYDQTQKFHTKSVTGLQNGRGYDYFVRCQDLAGNANIGDVLISFSIAQ